MNSFKPFPALDMFRLAAAIFVIAIHTSPLSSYTASGDFLLTRVFCRVAVPFFFLSTGYFLAKNHWRSTRRFLKKAGILYGVSILLYLPVNLYAHSFSLAELPKKLFFDGTLYHLWYFPAVMLGVCIVSFLCRRLPKAALPVSVLLYLIGLGGDSYYGIVSRLPPLQTVYEGIFSIVSYTRNGLFFAPLFLLLGAAGHKFRKGTALLGFLLCFGGMSAEALFLRSRDIPRHDSMYLFLPLCMVFLFSLLLRCNQGQRKSLRRCSMLLYLLHPWCILLVRGGAKVLGLSSLFVENSLLHFMAVLLLSLVLSSLLAMLWRRLSSSSPNPAGRAFREISLSALSHNVQCLTSLLPPHCRLIAVVKADAYGHGAAAIAHALHRMGVREFAVACLSEAIALRKAGIRDPILVLGYTPPSEATLLRQYRITQTVADETHGELLASSGERLHVQIGLDTGMHRLGIPAEEFSVLCRLFRHRTLIIDGMFTHLCAADGLEHAAQACTAKQLHRFFAAAEALQTVGYAPKQLHTQASYGLLNLPPQACNRIRAGIALYGVYSHHAPVRYPQPLQPVLSLRARVASVRTIQKGESAGYGCTFQAPSALRVATVSIGYADGLPRNYHAAFGKVLLHGRYVPIVCPLCMDQMLLDVSSVEHVQPGDLVTIIGRDGTEIIRAEDIAVECGTIANELLSRLSPRLGLVLTSADTDSQIIQR